MTTDNAGPHVSDPYFSQPYFAEPGVGVPSASTQAFQQYQQPPFPQPQYQQPQYQQPQFPQPQFPQQPVPQAPQQLPPPPPPGSLSLAELVPLRSWWQAAAWRRGWLGLFIACAIAPFILLQATQHDQDVRHAAWGFTIYYAVIWLVVIRALVKPEPVSIGRLAQVIVITGVLGVSVAITIERHLAADTHSLLKSILTVGFPEELAKAIPLLLVLLTTGNRIRPRTYLYLGAVSGLTFGAVESVAYTALYSDGIQQTGDTNLVTGIIWRLLTDSIFHAAMAGIVGVFIGFAAILRRRQLLLIVTGLSVAAILHGTYDRTAGHWTGVIVAALVMFVFAGYVYSSDDIVAKSQPAWPPQPQWQPQPQPQWQGYQGPPAPVVHQVSAGPLSPTGPYRPPTGSFVPPPASVPPPPYLPPPPYQPPPPPGLHPSPPWG